MDGARVCIANAAHCCAHRHRATCLCLKQPDTLTPAQHTLLTQLDEADPALASAHTLARQFATVARECQSAHLESWIATAMGSTIPNLRRFATGLLPDTAAVQTSLTAAWSNGQTERHSNRLKTLTRQLSGRAQFDRWRQRFLDHP